MQKSRAVGEEQTKVSQWPWEQPELGKGVSSFPWPELSLFQTTHDHELGAPVQPAQSSRARSPLEDSEPGSHCLELGLPHRTMRCSILAGPHS